MENCPMVQENLPFTTKTEPFKKRDVFKLTSFEWEDFTPLIVATRRSSLEQMKALIEKGASVYGTDNEGSTALHHAAGMGFIDGVKYLLQMRSPVEMADCNQLTPIMWAARNNQLKIIKLLLKAGASSCTLNSANDSAFNIAVRLNYREIVKYLLQEGDFGQSRDKVLYLALAEASNMGNVELVRILVEAGAPINYPAEHIIPPLHLAAREGKVSTVSYLVTRNANMDRLDDFGYTPLMHAVINRQPYVIMNLQMSGVNVNTKNKNGLSALTLARKFGDEKIRKILNVADGHPPEQMAH
nr:ankyrin repeat and KH domain containing protein [Hymenolepis microstoma]